MEVKSFTARLLPETKNVVINDIPKYVKMPVKVEYDHNSRENKLHVNLVDEYSTEVACLLFDDLGVHILKKLAPKLHINIKALTELWQAELAENFGREYNNYVRTMMKNSSGTTI